MEGAKLKMHSLHYDVSNTKESKLIDVEINDDLSLDDEIEMMEMDDPFHQTLECVTNILLSDDFQNLQNDYCLEHCHKFNSGEENKLEHYTIYQQFSRMIESYIERKMEEEVTPLNFEVFVSELQNHSEEIDGEFFETLFALSDYSTFKEMMLSFQAHENLAGSFDINIEKF